MSADDNFDLQIMILSGPDDPDRATMGFATAVAAAASGSRVVVFMAMQGAKWASVDNGRTTDLKGFESVENYIEMLVDCDGVIEGCTSCVESFAQVDVNGDRKGLRESVVLAGLSTAAIRGTSTQTMVF